MSKTKTNLEEQKLAQSNQMDQDYWAEKGSREEIERGLRDDLNIAHLNLDAFEEDMKEAASKYGQAKMDYIKAGEALAKFLEANPPRAVAGVDFGPALDALDGLTIKK